MICLLISGQIAAGKTTLARSLASEYALELVSARTILEQHHRSRGLDRRTLQLYGAQLEKETRGRWLAEGVVSAVDPNSRVIVDSVRTESQAQAMREVAAYSLLVYLDAPRDIRYARFVRQRSVADVGVRAVDEILDHDLELKIPRLKDVADIVLFSGSDPATVLRGAKSGPLPAWLELTS